MQTLDQQLIEACKNGDTLTVEQLLQQGANPNAKDNKGRTPITIAAEYGHTDIITTLIQYGANPNITDHQGRKALHYAIQNCHDTTAEYLLTQLKLDPNSQDQWGRTLFVIAAAKGNIKILQLLVKLGVNPRITDYKGQNALHYATHYGHDEAVEYLITKLKFNPNSQDHEGLTPITIALLNKDIDLLKRLVSLGANPHITDHQGQTLLHYSAVFSRYENAQYLITELKLDPNAQDQWGKTPFLLATESGDIKMLRLLIQLGANPHIKSTSGKSALQYALEERNSAIAQYLITELNLDPNSQDRHGITPLMIAAKNGDIHIFKLLIQHGADPYIRDALGKSAIHYAIEYKNYDIVKYLLAQLQLDPNVQDHEGITPLIIAAQYDDIDMIRLLIQHGANPYTTDPKGQTILHQATLYGNYKVTKYLITHLKLDPNQQDYEGNTPLLIAMKHGRTFIAKILTQLGANPYIPNHQGETAAAFAYQRQISLGKPKTSTITL